jgi:hypothetical protein
MRPLDDTRSVEGAGFAIQERPLRLSPRIATATFRGLATMARRVESIARVARRDGDPEAAFRVEFDPGASSCAHGPGLPRGLIGPTGPVMMRR